MFEKDVRLRTGCIGNMLKKCKLRSAGNRLLFYMIFSDVGRRSIIARPMGYRMRCMMGMIHMPNKPLRPCNHPGCTTLVGGGYCNKHQTSYAYDAKRGSSASRGYTAKWSKASKAYLAENPWCAECLKSGRRTRATETDHIIPHKGNLILFWDHSNWQPLCHSCHSIKTAREDGGFGNLISPPTRKKF